MKKSERGGSGGKKLERISACHFRGPEKTHGKAGNRKKKDVTKRGKAKHARRKVLAGLHNGVRKRFKRGKKTRKSPEEEGARRRKRGTLSSHLFYTGSISNQREKVGRRRLG